MKEIEVSAGIIVNNEKVLCVQRNKGKYEYISYKYEFPGGKIEDGEDGKEALKRELFEEMKMDVRIEEMKYFMTVDHYYPDFKIKMHSYICSVEKSEFILLEHIDYKWLYKNDLRALDWAEADIPIVDALIKNFF